MGWYSFFMGEDEYEPHEIDLPEVFVHSNSLFELGFFLSNAIKREEEMSSLAREVLDRLYDEIGHDEDTASVIIGYIQRRHGWDVELLAERSEVDNILFQEHSAFDDEMWEKILNTDAISDLHHETYKLSQIFIRRAIKEVLRDEQESRLVEEEDDGEDPF